jgi:hypothetical protein
MNTEIFIVVFPFKQKNCLFGLCENLYIRVFGVNQLKRVHNIAGWGSWAHTTRNETLSSKAFLQSTRLCSFPIWTLRRVWISIYWECVFRFPFSPTHLSRSERREWHHVSYFSDGDKKRQWCGKIRWRVTLTKKMEKIYPNYIFLRLGTLPLSC